MTDVGARAVLMSCDRPPPRSAATTHEHHRRHPESRPRAAVEHQPVPSPTGRDPALSKPFAEATSRLRSRCSAAGAATGRRVQHDRRPLVGHDDQAAEATVRAHTAAPCCWSAHSSHWPLPGEAFAPVDRCRCCRRRRKPTGDATFDQMLPEPLATTLKQSRDQRIPSRTWGMPRRMQRDAATPIDGDRPRDPPARASRRSCAINTNRPFAGDRARCCRTDA